MYIHCVNFACVCLKFSYYLAPSCDCSKIFFFSEVTGFKTKGGGTLLIAQYAFGTHCPRMC